jgi:methionyl-tRNA formyltransferase
MKLKFTEEKPRIVLFAGKNLVSNRIWEFLINHDEFIVHTVNEGDEVTVDLITSYKPDVIITCYWPYLLKPDVIKIPKYG